MLVLLLPLAACQDTADAAVRELTDYYDALPGFSARVQARVELDGLAQDYVLDWTDAEGGYTVTIAEPEALSGISMHGTEAGGLQFSYDTVTLAVEPSGETLSPIEALAELLRDWRGSVPESYGFELYGEETALAVEFGHTLGAQVFSQRTWFSPETHAPLASEVYSGGAMLARFAFSEFTPQK